MRDKKVKESIIKRERQQKLSKAKQLGNNAPLAKYYREQISTQAMDLNATGGATQLTLQANGEMTQTALGTGQTPRNVLEENGMRITHSGLQNKKKPVIARGLNHPPVAPGRGMVRQNSISNNDPQIRVGSASNRGTRRQWNS